MTQRGNARIRMVFRVLNQKFLALIEQGTSAPGRWISEQISILRDVLSSSKYLNGDKQSRNWIKQTI